MPVWPRTAPSESPGRRAKPPRHQTGPCLQVRPGLEIGTRCKLEVRSLALTEGHDPIRDQAMPSHSGVSFATMGTRGQGHARQQADHRQHLDWGRSTLVPDKGVQQSEQGLEHHHLP